MTERAAPIRTDSDALAFIAAQVEAGKIAQPRIENGKVLHSRKCVRCGGTGLFVGIYSAGVCFGCGGKPERMQWQEWVPVKKWAQYIRGKVREQDKRDASYAARIARERTANAERGLGELSHREIVEAQRETIPADRKARAALREHVGTVGEALEIEATLVHVFDTTSRYGALFIHRFIDAAGNTLVWMTNKRMPTALRTRVALRASVKEHSSYRGEAQTLLTGVKVVADLGPDTIDTQTLIIACDLADELGLATFVFTDRQTLTSGTADEQTLHRLHDHPAIRRVLPRLTAVCARAA